MKKTSQKGFTLIELLIVIGLIGLTVGVTGDIILSLVRSYSKTQATNELERSSNFVVSKIEKEFKNASSVVLIDAANDTVSFYTKRYGDSATYPVTYIHDICTLPTGNVGCLKRCPKLYSACNAGDYALVTNPEDVIVLASPGFSVGSVGTTVSSLSMGFKFQKNLGGGVVNSPFSGELVVQTTVVAKGTYQ